MTKSTRISLAVAAVLGMTATVPAVSGEAAIPCSSITFHQDFLKRYPQAPAACRGVVEKNGSKMVHFVATVADNSGGKVSLTFLNVRNQPIANTPALIFTPNPAINLSVNGKPKAVKDLQRGDMLDFWVPEGRTGIITDPNSGAVTAIGL